MECYGFKVNMVKMDPYINIDPGTLNKFVITMDGAELSRGGGGVRLYCSI